MCNPVRRFITRSTVGVRKKMPKCYASISVIHKFRFCTITAFGMGKPLAAFTSMQEHHSIIEINGIHFAAELLKDILFPVVSCVWDDRYGLVVG